MTLLDKLMARIYMEPMSGCWLWTASLSTAGYGRFDIMSDDGKYREQRVHRVMWEQMRGLIPNGLHVLHKCDVKCCVNPNHLYLGTDDDNRRDSYERGLFLRGEKHPRAKLNNGLVREIKRDRANGLLLSEISHKHRLPMRTVCNVTIGRTWSHIKPDADK